jgi:asparagine synthase (glutamine-hydrolysing)
MCGFAGFLGFGALGVERVSAIARNMGEAIRHRGPDDAGVWRDVSGQIALVHQRLSILDLSPAGHQPMSSPSGRYVMAFNGEIYNHLILRRELENVAPPEGGWRGHSDTETLLASIDAWGLEATLNRAVGMFALALWDRNERLLFLARDRVGEKPLYFGWQGHGQQRVFLFGSELSALKAHPQFAASIDRGALALLMRHNYIPAPYSIHEGIAKLEPGTLVQVSLAEQEPQVQRYWDFLATARAGRAQPFTGTPEQSVDALEALLKDAIGQQMVADVPLGAFLSGGIDSSTVVALMQAQSSRPVKTYTIGFHEEGYNEAVHAKAVATHLGTDHAELYVTPEQAMAVIPRLASLFSEPFADSSQIPTFLVSELARRHVTVSLSGDAGDELFGGYERYRITSVLWGKISRVPLSLRHLAGNIVTSLPISAWEKIGSMIGMSRLGERVHKGAPLAVSRDVDDFYRQAVSQWADPGSVVRGRNEPPTVLTSALENLQGLTDVERMMALDSVSYLPDDILVKVDRAAMGVSLETRVPFLDHRVIEFAWRLPLDYKVCGGVTKWPLRQVLYRHVPEALIDRPKRGFAVPVDAWLRGPLREWAENLLSETRLKADGYFYDQPIRNAWKEHVSGKRNWSSRLWIVLMFQAWLEHEATHFRSS